MSLQKEQLIPYKNDDIVIVGAGCVLPEASDTESFWKNLLTGHCSIAPMPTSRWDAQLYVSSDPKAPDKCTSNLAAFVREEQVEALRKKYPAPELNRLQLFTLEATTQALKNFPQEDRSRHRFGIFLGCMGTDEELSWHKLLEEQDSLDSLIESQTGIDRDRLRTISTQTFQSIAASRKPKKEATLASAAISTLKKHFSLFGEGCLIDAACASSLAALDLAIEQLKGGRCDIALAGGMEDQLAPENFVVFSQVGLLAKALPHPLDESADGLCQGEGAVVFALQRMEQARRQRRHILGVLRACGGSSNGRASSLFSPTINGQTIAIERARQKLPQRKYHYIECHGTGTRTGDRTELRALNEMQKAASEKTPVGSVKALIGHTKGAAGAAGLLKCLLSLQHRTLPPSPYFHRFAEAESLSQLTVNKVPVSLSQDLGPLCYGVSSAGFGGANYHAILEEYVESTPILSSLRTTSSSQVALIARTRVQDPEIRETLRGYKFKLPPANLAQIDSLQLQALVAVAHAFRDFHIPLSSLDHSRVSVFSCGCTGIEASYQFSKRIRHQEFLKFAQGAEKEIFERHKEKFPPVTEETGPGILNNVIAGRVSNLFDFTAKNLNIDADFASLGCALQLATVELQSRSSDLVIVLQAEESFEETSCQISRQGVNCYFLTLLETAQHDNRSVLSVLSSVDYEEQWLSQT